MLLEHRLNLSTVGTMKSLLEPMNKVARFGPDDAGHCEGNTTSMIFNADMNHELET
jgi:hypothetical protein